MKWSVMRRLALGLGLAGLAVGLSSCGMLGKKSEDMACPEIRIDRDTSKLTAFDPNGGQDITDIQFEAQILAFNGDCGWDPKTRTIDAKLKVLFQVARGPALKGLEGNFEYFVAVPAFYPATAGKQVLPVTFRFNEGNLTTQQLRDEEVKIRIPLGADKKSSDTPIYIGFQLTSKQLDFNRKLAR